MIRSKEREIFTEQGNSIQSPRFFFNGNYNRKKGERL